MTFLYTRSDLKSRVNAGVQGRIGMVVDENELMNEAARTVLGDIDTASSERKYSLAPKLFNDIYIYGAPADIKEQGIIDVPAQIKTDDEEWYLTTPQEFYRTKEHKSAIIAIDMEDGLSKLLLAKNLDDENRVIAEMDSLSSGGGTWQAFGDAENIVEDSDNYVKGSGSIRFDISDAGGTTAGLENTNLDAYDLSDFLNGDGAAFAWGQLSDASDITNFVLRLGTDASNYYTKTVTADSAGNAFVAGWNLLRFDLTSLTKVGTPDSDALKYAAIYMTKTSGKVSQTNFNFDWLVLKKGAIYNVKYYSKYPWADGTTNAWKELSDDDGDYIIANATEFDLFVLKGRQLLAQEVNEFEIATIYERQYNTKAARYIQQNPSKRKVETTGYYDFGRIV